MCTCQSAIRRKSVKFYFILFQPFIFNEPLPGQCVIIRSEGSLVNSVYGVKMEGQKTVGTFFLFEIFTFLSFLFCIRGFILSSFLIPSYFSNNFPTF